MARSHTAPVRLLYCSPDVAVTVVSKDVRDASPFPSPTSLWTWALVRQITSAVRQPNGPGRSDRAPMSAAGPGRASAARREPIATPGAIAVQTYEDAFAVDVPGISVPQNGCEETGVKPVSLALTIQAQLFES
jgi:hypothetical protein